MFRVYLAGTISADQKHLWWRDAVRRRLAEQVIPHIHTIDPLRFQDPKNFSEDGLHDKTCPDSLFVATDVNDVSVCDAMLIVFWKNGRQSVGTWAEFGVALWLHTPIIVVTDDPNVSDHPFIKRYAAYVTQSIDDACHRIMKIAR